jgi:hypothetical protein
VDYGLSNLAEECAAQGRDWEENLVQLAREQAAAKELGVEIYGSTEKPAAAPAKEIDPDDPAALDVAAFEGLKQEADAYGVCVRAGAITPQLDDEEHFRSKAGLPGVSDVIRKAWTDDEGVRRPITLKYKDDEAPAQPAEDDDAKAE